MSDEREKMIEKAKRYIDESPWRRIMSREALMADFALAQLDTPPRRKPEVYRLDEEAKKEKP